MRAYAYLAIDAKGAKQKGTLYARSEREARQLLREQAVYPTSIRPAHQWKSFFQQGIRFGGKRAVTAMQLSALCRQFGTLLEATIPYNKSLELITKDVRDPTLKQALSQVQPLVMEGAYLADAMQQQDCFPPLMVSMIRSGEASGTLMDVMKSLAEHYENLHQLQTRIKSALTYPIFMMVFGFAVILFLMVYVVPKITALFDQFNSVLPLITRILIGASTLLADYGWAVAIVVCGAIYMLRRYLNTARGKYWIDRLDLAVPGWNQIRRKILVQRFAQTLSALLNSGIELKQALAVTGGLLENQFFYQAVEQASLGVQNKGMSLSKALEQSNYFPEDVCQMIAIGEETGALPAMLANLARRLDHEVRNTLTAYTSLLEPVMILVMGLAIGVIVMAVLLPLLQLNQLVSG